MPRHRSPQERGSSEGAAVAPAPFLRCRAAQRRRNGDLALGLIEQPGDVAASRGSILLGGLDCVGLRVLPHRSGAELLDRARAGARSSTASAIGQFGGPDRNGRISGRRGTGSGSARRIAERGCQRAGKANGSAMGRSVARNRAARKLAVLLNKLSMAGRPAAFRARAAPHKAEGGVEFIQPAPGRADVVPRAC